MLPCRDLKRLETYKITHVPAVMKAPGGLHRDEEQRVKGSKDTDGITDGEQ
jgi:hypothetical protein